MTAAQALAGEKVGPVYELFPFWEEEEKNTLRREAIKAQMRAIAGGGGR